MNAIHHHSHKSIELPGWTGSGETGLIGDPSARSWSLTKIPTVAFVVAKGKPQLPGKVCSKVKWIIGTIRLHQNPIFIDCIVFIKREMVVEEISVPVLGHFVQRFPGGPFVR